MDQEGTMENQKKKSKLPSPSTSKISPDTLPLPRPTLVLSGSDSKTLEPEPFKKVNSPFSKSKSKDDDGKPKAKRSYTKRRRPNEPGAEFEKPPPKKRGRKSKKELQLLDMGDAENQHDLQKGKPGSFSNKQTNQKIRTPRKPALGKPKKKQSGTGNNALGSSMFGKKFFAGPHLTVKQVLEYILTDHSYCVPPDPLPAVASNHQMLRFILGPKNGAKALPPSFIGGIETGSPIIFPFSKAKGKLTLPSTSTPPPTSKLENLLKYCRRGDVSPMNTFRMGALKNSSDFRDESDIEIDVDGVDGVESETENPFPYDFYKARDVMNECEKYVEFARDNDTGDNWESKVLRTGWTKSQNALFDKVVNVLHAERLSRLAFKEVGDKEPILRRASLDKTACRIRRIFGEFLWDTKLTQWLHSMLNESLNTDYLAIYLDVLQTLKSQCPQLISRMLKLSVILPLQNAYGRETELTNLLTPFLEDSQDGKDQNEEFITQSQSSNETDVSNNSTATEIKSEALPNNENDSPDIFLPKRSVARQMQDAVLQLHSAKNAEALKALLERQWDPFSPVIFQRLRKLSSNPIFIFITPGALFRKLSLSQRLKQYERMFRRVGQVFRIRPKISEALHGSSATTYLEKIITMAKEKIKKVRQFANDRPIYLVGWGVGGILAAKLSVSSGPVDGIVALGFPLHGLREMHEDILKIFTGIKHPVLFVIGGLASNNSLTDMELFRKRLACETSLIVIGSGNENLYVTRDHREKLLVTQLFVDKNIVDEIAYFVNLHSKHNQIIAPNISMKSSQFLRTQSNGGASARRSINVLRGKKRKNSPMMTEPRRSFDSCTNIEYNSIYDSEYNSVYDSSSNKGMESNLKTEMPMTPPTRPYDFNFEGPKFTPSKSSNKRKTSLKSDNLGTSSPALPASTSTCLTASQLVQQGSSVKKRTPRPSGATRVPMLGQYPNSSLLRPGQDTPATSEVSTDSSGVSSKLFGITPNQPITLSTPICGHSESTALAVMNDPISSLVNASSPSSSKIKLEKGGKKKPSKSKSSEKTLKHQKTDSPTSAIVSAISEVSSQPIGNAAISSTPSSLDMHKYVLQHQQMVKQLEQTQNRAQTSSQLYKLLSPESETSALSRGVPTPIGSAPSEVLKLKLIGSQQIPPEEMLGDERTTLISKQNLMSNLSLPIIRVPTRPGSTVQEVTPTSSQPIFVTSGASTGTAFLPTQLQADTEEKILVRTGDKSIKLTSSDLKQLISSANQGFQFVTGMTGEGQFNFMITKAQESNDVPSSLISMTASAHASTSNTVGSVLSSYKGAQQLQNMPFLQNSIVSIPVSSTESDGQSYVDDSVNVANEESGQIAVSNEETEDGMDVDDEFCGIKISSTFSVCPTSGAPVQPVALQPSENIEQQSTLSCTENENATPPVTAAVHESTSSLNEVTAGYSENCASSSVEEQKTPDSSTSGSGGTVFPTPSPSTSTRNSDSILHMAMSVLDKSQATSSKTKKKPKKPSNNSKTKSPNKKASSTASKTPKKDQKKKKEDTVPKPTPPKRKKSKADSSANQSPVGGMDSDEPPKKTPTPKRKQKKK